MDLAHTFVNGTIWGITHLLCRINTSELVSVPSSGPLILVTNHINFLDIPLLYTHLQPRPLTGLVKSETWQDPLLRPLFDLWKAIPVQRGEADVEAMRHALRALHAGKIVAVAPEGTRSGDGRLLRARPGVIVLAQMSGAPLLPVAFWGVETFWHNTRHLRRTDFQVRVGPLLRLRHNYTRLGKDERQAAVDELMGELACLLPEANRGVYSGQAQMERNYFETG